MTILYKSTFSLYWEREREEQWKNLPFLDFENSTDILGSVSQQQTNAVMLAYTLWPCSEPKSTHHLYNWSLPQGTSDLSFFQLHQTALLLRNFPLHLAILCPYLTTLLLQLLNSFPFTLSPCFYLTHYHPILLLDCQPCLTDNCDPILLNWGLFLPSGQTIQTMRMLVTTYIPSSEVLDKHQLLPHQVLTTLACQPI